MTYGFKASLAFNTAAARNDIATWIANRLQTENLWQPPQWIKRQWQGNPALRVRVWWVASADRNQFWTDLQAQLVGANLPVAGSNAQAHDCSHDEMNPALRMPCAPGPSRAW